jgi:hypothetical protein
LLKLSISVQVASMLSGLQAIEIWRMGPSRIAGLEYKEIGHAQYRHKENTSIPLSNSGATPE